MSRFEVTSISGSEPVALQEIKDNLEIEVSDWDDMLLGMLAAARSLVEQQTGLELISKRITQYLDVFPAGGEEIEILKNPVREVKSIKYYDTDGSLQTWSSSNYRVDTTDPGRITEAYNVSWPSTRAMTNAVEILYDCGPVNASAAPQAAKQIIHLCVNDWFEHRDLDRPRNLPTAATDLIWSLKRVFV